jgi:2'-deoxynucleoside 5'-phosphate N-hydrolase
MRIYFAGSIRGGRKYAAFYYELINFLKNYGEVLTEHVGNKNLTHDGDNGFTDHFIHDRDMEWLISSDFLVAEVTIASMGVGYEIGQAVAAGKPVLCLYRNVPGKTISAMIAGCPRVELFRYTKIEEAKQKITEVFKRHSM